MKEVLAGALLTVLCAAAGAMFALGRYGGRADGYRAGYAAGLSVKKPAPPVAPLSLIQFDTCGRTVGWLLVRTDGSTAYGAWEDMEDHADQQEAVATLAAKTGGLITLQFDCLL